MFPIETISAKMLDYFIDRSDSLIIDIRDPDSFRKSHIRGAVNCPYEELNSVRNLPKDKLLIFYCQRGGSRYVCRKTFPKKRLSDQDLLSAVLRHIAEEIL